MTMLRELEKLLSEIAQQQGGPQQAPAVRPPAPPPQPLYAEAEIVEAEPVEREVRRASAKKAAKKTAKKTAKQAPAPGSAPPAEHRQQGHDRFDQELKLRDAPDLPAGETPRDVPLVADQIAQLLSDVNNVRQAIIMNEILNRPVDRWR